MHVELQQVLIHVTIVVLIMMAAFTCGVICFFFPKKCDNCGEKSAYKSVRNVRTETYTPEGCTVSTVYVSQKICVSCGFVSAPKLESKKDSEFASE